MSSPAKQPPGAAKKGGGGWGSLLSGAVAGLESRLDTILADEPEASAKQRAAEQTGRSTPKPNTARTNSASLAPPSRDAVGTRSRDVSSSRGSDRLAERLAKAAAAKTPSQVPSRTGSPAVGESARARASGEEEREDELARSVPEIGKVDGIASDGPEKETAAADDESTMGDSTLLSPDPSRLSAESSRPSIEIPRSDLSSRPSFDLPNGTSSKPATELELAIDTMREEQAQTEKQRQEEMHTYLEKIDALQAKLSYLAKETVAAAKEANASSASHPDGDSTKLAEKDERMALLMQEGENLSKKELQHLQTIKKLRAHSASEAKDAASLKQKLERAEGAEKELKVKLRRADVAEREKGKVVAGIEAQVEELRTDRESAAELVRNLTAQLKEAKERAERAEKENREVDRGKIAQLENEVEDAGIEKKLAEDRAAAEVRKVREEVESMKQRFSVRELELKNEIAGLESRVEAMRSRAEEASTDASGGGEANTKLLRQTETLQSQYALAKENWETIESSLTARLAALEKERDESLRREAEARRKAREVGIRARRADEELELAAENSARLERILGERGEEVEMLKGRVEVGERELGEVGGEVERLRGVWEMEVGVRVEEEKARWLRGAGREGSVAGQKVGKVDSSGAFSGRKASNTDVNNLQHSSRRPGTGQRHELAALNTDPNSRPTSSRRSSRIPSAQQTPASTHRAHNQQGLSPLDHSTKASPAPSIQETTNTNTTTPAPPAGLPETPSLELSTNPLENDTFGTPTSADHFPTPTSPTAPDQRTLPDLLSTTTAPTSGPSVQLVERMSAAVRRLESEKSASRDELARLSSQRDAARDEVVSLLRDLDARGVQEGEGGEVGGGVGGAEGAV